MLGLIRVRLNVWVKVRIRLRGFHAYRPAGITMLRLPMFAL